MSGADSLALQRRAVAPIMTLRARDRRDAMAKARPHPWTVEDFLAFEAEEPETYEFVDGIVA